MLYEFDLHAPVHAVCIRRPEERVRIQECQAFGFASMGRATKSRPEEVNEPLTTALS
jgi:hypothetical protein